MSAIFDHILAQAEFLVVQIHTYDRVLLFAGGVGITFVFPQFVRIALHSPSTICKLVWMVRDLGKSVEPSPVSAVALI